MSKFIDSHSHLNFPAYDADRNEVIKRMASDNVASIIVGTTRQTSRDAVDLAQHHNNLWAAVGIHPAHAQEHRFFDKQELRQAPAGAEIFDEPVFRELLSKPRVVAVGECGLDYFHQPYSPERQQKLFLDQANLAKELSKPVIVHCRDAHQDMLKLIGEISGLKGVIHFFSGTMEQAREYINLGFYLSFGGAITFGTNYDELVLNLPLERIMIETDCPYVAPAPFRGQRNEPSYVIEVAKKISELKKISLDEVTATTTKNARELFNLW